MAVDQTNSAGMDARETLLGRDRNYNPSKQVFQQVELLQIDMTKLGGPVMYVTNRYQNGYDETTNVTGFFDFQGNRYFYTPYETEGWEWNGNGNMPNPTITVMDFDGELLNDIYKYQNLLGATIRRYLAIDDFNYRGPEEWVVLQRLETNENSHKFKLGTILAARSSKIPGRNMFRDEFPGMQRYR